MEGKDATTDTLEGGIFSTNLVNFLVEVHKIPSEMVAMTFEVSSSMAERNQRLFMAAMVHFLKACDIPVSVDLEETIGKNLNFFLSASLQMRYCDIIVSDIKYAGENGRGNDNV